MVKNKNMLTTKNTILISVITAMLIFAGIFVYSRNNTSIDESGKKQEAVGNNEPEIKEEIKDGVYTNYTYGFSFEYDDLKFNDVRKWKKFTGKNFFTKGWLQPSLNVKYSVGGSSTFFSYEDCISTNIGSTIEISHNSQIEAGLPIYEKTGLLNDFCIMYVEPYGMVSGIANKGWSYSAIRKDESNKKIVFITWTESNFNNLVSIKPHFNALIESFTFINTN